MNGDFGAGKGGFGAKNGDFGVRKRGFWGKNGDFEAGKEDLGQRMEILG